MLKEMRKRVVVRLIAAAWLLGAMLAAGRADGGYQIFVSNEKSGDLTVISSDGFKVVATIPVGKRPRGIRASPDGRTVYVALSGTLSNRRPSSTPTAIRSCSRIRTTMMTR